jgi:hypothetical protein
MGAEFDAATYGQLANATSHTISHTCSGSNRMLYVFIGGSSANVAASNVTYNGVSLSDRGSVTNGGDVLVELWVWDAGVNGEVPSGAHDVVATFPSSTDIGIGAMSFKGALQDFPSSVPTNTGNSATPSIAIPSDGVRLPQEWLAQSTI